jgi:hypothetical protein
MSLAERIRARIPERGRRWPLTASVGVAVVDPRRPGDVVDVPTLMRQADFAMYEAKRRGKNQVAAAVTAPERVNGTAAGSRPAGRGTPLAANGAEATWRTKPTT